MLCCCYVIILSRGLNSEPVPNKGASKLVVPNKGARNFAYYRFYGRSAACASENLGRLLIYMICCYDIYLQCKAFGKVLNKSASGLHVSLRAQSGLHLRKSRQIINL